MSPAAVAAAGSDLSAWPHGTPRTEDRPLTTSSYRVTMLGLAPPPEVEALRARHAAASGQLQDEPPTLPDQPAAGFDSGRARRPSQPPPTDSARTRRPSQPPPTDPARARRSSQPPPTPARVSVGYPAQHAERARRTSDQPMAAPPGLVHDDPSGRHLPMAAPPGLVHDDPSGRHLPAHRMSGRLPLASPPTTDPSLGDRIGHLVGEDHETFQMHPPDGHVSGGVVDYPISDHSQPHPRVYDDMADIAVPRSRYIGAIQIGLIIGLCVGAAVLGYFLVPSAADDSGATVDADADAAGAGAGAGDADAAAIEPAAIDAGTPVLQVLPDAGAKAAIIDYKGGEIPIVSGERLTRVSGKAPRVRTLQMTGPDGQPVVIQAQLCIDDEGKVTEVDIIDSPNDLDKRSRKALRKWRYKPFRLDGRRTPVCFDVSVRPRDK